MKHVRYIAILVLAAELVLAAVLLVGLMVPLPGALEFKIVQSGSMEPEIPVGSVVVITPSPSYGVGDVITFGDDTKKRIPTTHRIVDVEREAGSIRYVTKGDANEEKDNTSVAFVSVIGKVVTTVPRLGYVLDFARSQQGFTFMVLIPAVLIMLDELINIYKVVQGNKRRVAVRSAKRVPARHPVGTPNSAARVMTPIRYSRVHCIDLRPVT
jgi:signal peptidase